MPRFRPLYEVFDGAACRINEQSDGTDLAGYFERQRRFADDDIDLDATREICAQRTRHLELLAEEFPYVRN